MGPQTNQSRRSGLFVNLLTLMLCAAAVPVTVSAQNSGPALPPGFEAPPPKPELLTLDKELLPEGADDEFKKIQTKYNTARRSGDTGQRDLVIEGLKYRVLRMASKSERESLHARRREIIRDVRDAARLKGTSDQARRYREFVLEQVMGFAQQLLDNNFYVRLNAVILLTELDLVDGNPVRRIEAVPYTPAFEPLLTVVADAAQPEAVKIAAVRGLSRIARLGSLDNPTRVRAGRTLVAELERRDTSIWYQTRLAEALGNVTIARIAVGGAAQPLIVQTLVETLIDDKRHWITRSEAAKALGRAEMDGEVRADLVSYKIAEFAWQLALAYRNRPREFYWTNCFLKVYLAYRPEDEADKQRDGGLLLKAESGAMSAYKPVINDAFEKIKPLVVHMTKQSPSNPKDFARNDMVALQRFLASNKPDVNRLDPGSPELSPGPSEAQERPGGADSD